MAHDLWTTLAIVQGYTEGLLDGGTKHADRLQRYLSIINKNTKRAIRLVQDMGMVSDMDRPEFRLLIRNINVSQYMSEKCAEYRQLCEQQNVQFEGEISIDPDRLIALDTDWISQLLDNVTTNAIRYTLEAEFGLRWNKQSGR